MTTITIDQVSKFEKELKDMQPLVKKIKFHCWTEITKRKPELKTERPFEKWNMPIGYLLHMVKETSLLNYSPFGGHEQVVNLLEKEVNKLKEITFSMTAEEDKNEDGIFNSDMWSLLSGNSSTEFLYLWINEFGSSEKITYNELILKPLSNGKNIDENLLGFSNPAKYKELKQNGSTTLDGKNVYYENGKFSLQSV